MLQFYNTLSRKKEAFIPIEEGHVRLYTCGPTVYNYAHIGNYRAYMFEDLLRRFLLYKGYKVTQVMNITDVDDKIIRDANAENVDFRKFTAPYKKAFFEDLDTLRVQKAEHYPEATGHIDEMVHLVEALLEHGYAYRTEDGSIYYSVEKFEDYGQLANINPGEMQHSERVEADEYDKESIRDFALWKAWKPEDGDICWETSLGKGRPGWHIECSAMSTTYLGNHFDIHTGGVDNIFPHHENEIAQSQAATGEQLVNYWLHCEHLIVEGEKMSKSLGNFYNLREVLDKGYAPEVIRYVLLSTHYRQKLNFTWEKLEEAAAAIERLRNVVTHLENVSGDGDSTIDELLEERSEEFESTLDDDLNIAGALGIVFSLVKDLNQRISDGAMTNSGAVKALKTLRQFDEILDVLESSEKEQDVPKEIQQLLQEREEARAAREYDKADAVRDEIQAKGFIVEDTPDGAIVKPKK
ncbi:MAG: Cysteine--tRNA ligase [Candidatus Marinimicrobia bacterium]|nr:Cysteine--tRNA ligase [Candidatus Neomarinimicrobiota bacterium]